MTSEVKAAATFKYGGSVSGRDERFVNQPADPVLVALEAAIKSKEDTINSLTEDQAALSRAITTKQQQINTYRKQITKIKGAIKLYKDDKDFGERITRWLNDGPKPGSYIHWFNR